MSGKAPAPEKREASTDEKNDDQNPPAGSPFAISDAILIAASTALAYFYSYRFERGFLHAHHIGPGLVEVSLGTVLFAVGALGYRLWNWLLLLILVLPPLIEWWGEESAKAQSTYPTFNYQGRAWAIVRVYGDRWIVREVNYSTSEFQDVYAVMEAQPVVLSQTKINRSDEFVTASP